MKSPTGPHLSKSESVINIAKNKDTIVPKIMVRVLSSLISSSSANCTLSSSFFVVLLPAFLIVFLL